MLRLLKNLTLKNWISVAAIFLLTLAQVFFTMEIVNYISKLTGAVQASRTNGVAEIWWYGLYMVICAMLMAAVEIVIRYMASATAASVATNLRQRLYERVNEFALSDFASFSTESLITRTTNDIQNIHLAMLTALRTVFVAPITMVWSILLLIEKASPSLTVVTAIWLFILVVAVIALILMLTPKFKQVQKLTDALNVSSRENLTGVRVVRAFNAESYQEDKFDKVNSAFTKVSIFSSRAISMFSPLVIMVMMGLTLSILWASAYVLNGMDMELATKSFNATNAFVMLANQVVMSFVLLITLIVIWPRASVCARRINEVIKHTVSVVDTDSPVPFKEQGTIEFRNVSFAYLGADKDAVSGITFKVNKGEPIAFIGATGSGKTTIINMIPRMADCTSGEVLVDGVNVKDVLQSDLRSRIGYAPQRGFLFKGNIKENIAFSNPNMTLADVRWAARIADADSFVSKKRNEYESEVAQGGTLRENIVYNLKDVDENRLSEILEETNLAHYVSTLPQGLDTVIQKESALSAGQKQLVTIARAMTENAPMLILDEATSNVDTRTEILIQNAMDKLTSGRTSFVIAHRLSTIKNADFIFVMKDGNIVETGNPNIIKYNSLPMVG